MKTKFSLIVVIFVITTGFSSPGSVALYIGTAAIIAGRQHARECKEACGQEECERRGVYAGEGCDEHFVRYEYTASGKVCRGSK